MATLLLSAAISCDHPTDSAPDLGELRVVELTNLGGCDFGGPRPPFQWQVRLNCQGAAQLDDYASGSLEQWVGTVEASQWGALAQAAQAVDWRSVNPYYQGGPFGPDNYSVRVVFANGEQSTSGNHYGFPEGVTATLRALSEAKSRLTWRPREQ